MKYIIHIYMQPMTIPLHSIQHRKAKRLDTYRLNRTCLKVTCSLCQAWNGLLLPLCVKMFIFKNSSLNFRTDFQHRLLFPYGGGSALHSWQQRAPPGAQMKPFPHRSATGEGRRARARQRAAFSAARLRQPALGRGAGACACNNDSERVKSSKCSSVKTLHLLFWCRYKMFKCG